MIFRNLIMSKNNNISNVSTETSENKPQNEYTMESIKKLHEEKNGLRRLGHRLY